MRFIFSAIEQRDRRVLLSFFSAHANAGLAANSNLYY